MSKKKQKKTNKLNNYVCGSKLNIHTKLVLNIVLIVLLFFGSIYTFIMANDIGIKNKEALFSYKETSKVNYNVVLKQNPYYQTSSLGMNQLYPSSLIDKVNIKFKYNFKTDKPGIYTYNYFATASIIINNKTDNKLNNGSNTLLTRTYQLDNQPSTIEESTKEYNIDKDYVIDYNYFNTFVTNYQNTYNLSTSSYLKVTMYVQIVDSYQNETITKSKTMEVDIPLGTNPVAITTINPTDISDTIYNETNSTTSSSLFNIFAIIMFVSSILLFVQEIRKVLRSDKSQSTYIKQLNKIMIPNSEIIVKVKNPINLKDTNTIDVETIDELFDAQNELRIPIAYFETKRNKEGWFVIVNGKETWRYIFKVEDEK